MFMGLRPSKCYRGIEGPAYTRTSKTKPRKSYIKGVPGSKIVMFDMGNKRKEFDTQIHLVSLEPMQIRHNAIEAARITSNKYVQKMLGNVNYKMKIRVFPHQVMRENPLATGAGADRFSTGMKKAFGKPIGRTARIRANQKVMTIYTDKENIETAKQALRKAKMKIPCKATIEIENKKG